MGTPDYISPEQFLSAGRADARSDIYSLGCMWYELLCGHPPFAKVSGGAKMLAHQFDAPPDIRLLVPEVPETVSVILHKMLAKEAGERQQSCAQLLDELSHINASVTANPSRSHHIQMTGAYPVTPPSQSDALTPTETFISGATRYATRFAGAYARHRVACAG